MNPGRSPARILRRRAIRASRKARRRERHVDRTAQLWMPEFCSWVLVHEKLQREARERRKDYRAKRRAAAVEANRLRQPRGIPLSALLGGGL